MTKYISYDEVRDVFYAWEASVACGFEHKTLNTSKQLPALERQHPTALVGERTKQAWRDRRGNKLDAPGH